MVKFVVFLLLVLCASLSGTTKGDSCKYFGQLTGGCPDLKQCEDTCRPCYRGVGEILPECVAPGGDIPFWECRCYFLKGAPCPPPVPGPACPKPPVALPQQSSTPLSRPRSTSH